jgi:hypothetical protein
MLTSYIKKVYHILEGFSITEESFRRAELQNDANVEKKTGGFLFGGRFY